VTDYRSWGELAAAYERVTGRPTAYVEADDAAYAKLYGDFGTEFAYQLRWNEEFPDWHAVAGKENIISLGELGVADKLVRFEEAMEGLKGRFLDY